MSTSPTHPTLRLSALIVAFNEAEQIERCLKSLHFCDEIVLVDSESTDDTVALSRKYTERVWVEPWRGYGGQKQFALQKCRGEWIFWIDADEVVSPELAESILAVVGSGTAGGSDRDAVASAGRDTSGTTAGQDAVASAGRSPGASAGRDSKRAAGYQVARRVYYLGDWIRHGGWERDWVLRLFRREAGSFRLDLVHEGVELKGSQGRLDGPLDHYSYRNLSHHWQKIDQFTSLWAEQRWERREPAATRDLLFRPWARWFKIYVVKQGWRDGWRGAVVAGLAATYVLVKYAKLKEKQRRSDHESA